MQVKNGDIAHIFIYISQNPVFTGSNRSTLRRIDFEEFQEIFHGSGRNSSNCEVFADVGYRPHPHEGADEARGRADELKRALRIRVEAFEERS